MKSEREKLNKIAKGTSPWLQKAKQRSLDEDWLDDSAKIALAVLTHLKNNNISQANLAELIDVKPQQVYKIVKGKENLTLKTIKKIENALNIVLFEIPFNKESIDLQILDFSSANIEYTDSSTSVSSVGKYKKLSQLKEEKELAEDIIYANAS